MISKSQFIFDLVYKELVEILGVDNVYYNNPMDKATPYPFVVIGDVQSIPNSNKNAIFEKIYITVDFWGDINNRFKLSEFSLNLKNKLIENKLLINETSEQTLKDTSTNEVLFRNKLVLVFLI